jgi:hypothetical protein
MKIKQALVIIITLFLLSQTSHSQVNSASLQFHSMVRVDPINGTNLQSTNHNLKLYQKDKDLYINRIIPIFMVVAGIGIAGIWSADIASGKFAEQGNFFKWREGENLLWPHILAEYLTSAALITGGVGLYNSKECALNVSFCALGVKFNSKVYSKFN